MFSIRLFCNNNGEPDGKHQQHHHHRCTNTSADVRGAAPAEQSCTDTGAKFGAVHPFNRADRTAEPGAYRSTYPSAESGGACRTRTGAEFKAVCSTYPSAESGVVCRTGTSAGFGSVT
jgi:hypothetical protein